MFNDITGNYISLVMTHSSNFLIAAGCKYNDNWNLQLHFTRNDTQDSSWLQVK